MLSLLASSNHRYLIRPGASRLYCLPAPPEKLHIVFVGTEIAPWSKVGGLGDVLGALPRALASRGHEVMTVCPLYAPYIDTYDSGYIVPVEGCDGDVSRLFLSNSEGVDHVFVDHPAFSGIKSSDEHSNEKPRQEALYPYWWGGFVDFEKCYSILCQVALAAPHILWKTENPERSATSSDAESLLFVANDWPCGILPLWLRNYRACATQLDGPSDHGVDASSNPRQLLGLNKMLPEGCDHQYLKESVTEKRYPGADSKEGCRKATLQEANDDLPRLKNKVDRILGGAESEQTMRTHCSRRAPFGDPVREDYWDLERNSRLELDEELNKIETEGIAKAEERQNMVDMMDQSIPVPLPSLDIFQSKVGASLANAKIVFAIHNMAYQGRSFLESLEQLGYPQYLSRDFIQQSCDGSNWLSMGLKWSDLVLTVSPAYADELLAGGSESCGLSRELQAASVQGIRNGIDTDVWDPCQDCLLPKNMRYGIENVGEGKQIAKMALQESLGLDLSAAIPLFGFIGRLDNQKGVDLLMSATTGFLQSPPLPSPQSENETFRGQNSTLIQLVALGTGEEYLEEALKGLKYSFPGAAIGLAEFNETMAHRVLASCDYLLVPSRYEPCGQVAMCALRYGCIPIVSPVGGLLELAEKGVGIGLQCSPDATTSKKFVSNLIQIVREAACDYGSSKFKLMREVCMRVDVSWGPPAREWEKALKGLRQMADTDI